MPLVYPASILNPAPGVPISSAWGDGLNAAFAYIYSSAPRCKATKSSSQSISNTTETALTFDGEDYDAGAMHSTSSNTTKITIPTGEDGTYEFWAWAVFDSNTTGIRELYIRVNNTTTLCANQSEGIGSHDAHVNVFGSAELTAGDYIEAWVWQDSGGSLDVTKAAFAARKVAQ